MHNNIRAVALSAPYRWLLSSLGAAVLLACGGSGGGDSSVGSTITGAVVKGPVAGASVCAYALTAGARGAQLSCTTSDADGNYQLTLNYAGEVIVEAQGGSYTDEATGAKGVPLAEVLSVVGRVDAGGQQLFVTPLTARAVSQAKAEGGLTVANFDKASASVSASLGLPADTSLARTRPVVTGSVNAYGKALIDLSGHMNSGLNLGTFVGGTLYVNLTSPSCFGELKLAEATEPRPDGIYLINEGPADGGGMVFDVTDPVAAWRDLLPSSGTAMGCDILSNSDARVSLACPKAALDQQVVRFVHDPSADPLPATLPSAGLLLAGRRIDGTGGLALSGVNFVFPSATSAGTGERIPAAPVQIKLNNVLGGPIRVDLSVVNGSIRSNSGSVLTTRPVSSIGADIQFPDRTPDGGTIFISPSRCSDRS